ncbi:hypothetical protein CVT24_002236 [Panaeolus cyanescens]|uniref:Uncharacterized protein n=1 Tax=Panaeolus cyanescens TaxID=181874 RepID=A0A409YIG4_9AGAR|nr:hypothetical protein CVT24_002236 [Panaeolus cyanescens]
MAPLAGKPPFATDEPDSYYESSPQPRTRPPPPDNPNKRSSAYDVYDNYLKEDSSKLSAPSNNNNSPGNRTSGIGAMLMNLGDDDDDDDSDDDDNNPFSSRAHAKPAAAVPSTPTSKHAALAAAIAPSSSSSSSSSHPSTSRPSQEQQPRPSTSSANPANPFNSPPRGASAGAKPPGPGNHPPPPQMSMNGPPPSILQRPPPGPQPIAAPRPGYPAPIAALNLARPEPILTRGPQNPFESPAASPMRPQFAIAPSVPGSPAPSAATPHPLLPPVTPITPVFIKPAIPAPQSIKFEDGVATPRPAKTIMRGDREETLLPSRGEKGDDFWRRFSIVAKEENRKPSALKESSWLKKMQSGSSRHSRSVWIVGIILIVLIAGGVGFGVYATRNSPDNQAPTILGGADTKATAGPDTATTSVNGKGGASSTVLHVSPTFTVDRRDVGPEVTGVPVVRRHKGYKKRLEEW